MELQLGRPVISNDGVRIGQVERIVLDPASMELIEFIVHNGLVLSERIIDRRFIDHVDSEGTVHLSVDSDFAEQLPLCVEHGILCESPLVESCARPGRNPFLTRGCELLARTKSAAARDRAL